MPAAAVIPERQALFGIVGCKEYVGGIHRVYTKSKKGGIYFYINKNSWVNIKLRGGLKER